MGNVTSEKIIGTRTVDGRTVLLQASTWNNTEDVSYDLIDPDTREVLTTEHSFGDYPSDDEIREALTAEIQQDRWMCPGCYNVYDAGSDAANHVLYDCDKVDGAGQPI